MQIHVRCTILTCLAVRPDQERSIRWQNVARRDSELSWLGKMVRQVPASEIHNGGVGIKQLEPVLKIAISRVRQRRRVIGHPLVDEKRSRWRGNVVRDARCWITQHMASDSRAVW